MFTASSEQARDMAESRLDHYYGYERELVISGEMAVGWAPYHGQASRQAGRQAAGSVYRSVDGYF